MYTRDTSGLVDTGFVQDLLWAGSHNSKATGRFNGHNHVLVQLAERSLTTSHLRLFKNGERT